MLFSMVVDVFRNKATKQDYIFITVQNICSSTLTCA